MLGNDIVDLEHPDAGDAAANRRFQERVFSPEELSWLLLQQGESPIRFLYDLWGAWACKESAFKALRCRIPNLPFHWSRFIVSPDFTSVRHPEGRCDCRLLRGDGWIHAVALDRASGDAIGGEQEATSRPPGSPGNGESPDHPVPEVASSSGSAWRKALFPVRSWKTDQGGILYAGEMRMEATDSPERESVLSREMAVDLFRQTGTGTVKEPSGEGGLRVVRENDSPPRFASGDTILNIPLSLSHHGRLIGAALLLRPGEMPVADP